MESRNAFAGLLAEFGEAWIDLDGKHFYLDWRGPGSSSTWDPPYDREAHEHLGSVHLPMDGTGNCFTLNGSVTARRDTRLSSIRDKFKRLANRAGTALPPTIREGLGEFCPRDTDIPGSWWYALLWCLSGEYAYNPDGGYREHIILDRPHMQSVDAIQMCGLATAAPGFPEHGLHSISPTDHIMDESVERARESVPSADKKHTATREQSTEKGEHQSDDQVAVRLLSVFTNGLADERFERAAIVLQSDSLTVHEKLTKIDELIPFPPTVSAANLGQLVGGVSKQAVMKTEWWNHNRKGEKESEIGRRHDKHHERAKQYEPYGINDEDD